MLSLLSVLVSIAVAVHAVRPLALQVDVGNCSGHGTSYCKCDPGYTGDHCQDAVDYCSQIEESMIIDPGVNRTSVCGEHGRCVNKVLGAHCVCDDGFSGEFCEHVDGGGPWVLSHRCYVYAPSESTLTTPSSGDIPVGCDRFPGEECVPEDLNCFFYGKCDNPIGWCIPMKIDQMASFMAVLTGISGPSREVLDALH